MLENIMCPGHGTFDTQSQKTDGSPYHNTYYSGMISKEKVGESVDAGVLLYLDATAEELKIADSATGSANPAQCFSLEAGDDGDYIKVLWIGRLRNDSWDWTVGAELYLAEDGNGGFTETEPSTGGDLIQKVAVALSATEIVFFPNMAYTTA
jgi:hypothetical protein